MRLWIIGKRGLLSQAFQRKCQEKGIDYLATSRKEVDLQDVKSVRAQFETLLFTHVINCSGYTAVDRAEEESEAAHALNGEAVELLARLAKQHGKKMIHFSTDYVFDGKAEEYSEGAETAPLSVYGKSKERGEKKLFEQYPEACLVRTSWLFGRDGRDFVKKMVEMMQSQEDIRVVSDQKGRPTYADDLAEAVLSILDQSGIFHFANSGPVSWHEWALAIREKLRAKNVPLRCQKIHAVSTEAHGARAPRPKSSVLATEKFDTPHWEAGLEEVLSSVISSLK
ncbi:MAG: dTDP-4-dehydrorhamnose reductase [Simkaniaceae bacterium]